MHLRIQALECSRSLLDHLFRNPDGQRRVGLDGSGALRHWLLV